MVRWFTMHMGKQAWAQLAGGRVPPPRARANQPQSPRGPLASRHHTHTRAHQDNPSAGRYWLPAPQHVPRLSRQHVGLPCRGVRDRPQTAVACGGTSPASAAAAAAATVAAAATFVALGRVKVRKPEHALRGITWVRLAFNI